MKRVCVYCGSSPGKESFYIDAAKMLGKVLAENGLELVYGGASVGLMGAVADSVLDNGGTVTGVIPEMLNKHVSHPNLTKLHITGTMHERKTLMFDLSDAFIALPGGIGTLEELFEVMTWAQLGSHTKPCGVLNINGYYDKLFEFLAHTASQGFIMSKHLEILRSDHEPLGLLEQFRNYRSPSENKMDVLSLLDDAECSA